MNELVSAWRRRCRPLQFEVPTVSGVMFSRPRTCRGQTANAAPSTLDGVLIVFSDGPRWPQSRSAASMASSVTVRIPASMASVSSPMTANTTRSPSTSASTPPAAAPSGLLPHAISR